MARIPEGSFKEWKDGETIEAADYVKERETLRSAVNHNQDQINTIKQENASTLQLATDAKLAADKTVSQDVLKTYVDERIDGLHIPTPDENGSIPNGAERMSNLETTVSGYTQRISSVEGETANTRVQAGQNATNTQNLINRVEQEFATKTNLSNEIASVNQSINTVSSKADSKATGRVFFEDLQVERVSSDPGAYYMVRIPASAKIQRGFSSSSPTTRSTESGRTFAKRLGATALINGGVFQDSTATPIGVSVYNGTVISNNALAPSAWQYVLGINASGGLKAFAPGTTASSIISQGYANALTGNIPVIENSALVADSVFSKQPDATSRTVSSRQFIAQNSIGETYFFTFEYKTDSDMGWTLKECATVMRNTHNMVFAFNLDSGDNAQTYYYGSPLNRMRNGEKKVIDYLYVGKDIGSTNTSAEMMNGQGVVEKIQNEKFMELENQVNTLNLNYGSIPYTATSWLANGATPGAHPAVSSIIPTGTSVPMIYYMPMTRMAMITGVIDLTTAIGANAPFLNIPSSHSFLWPKRNLEFLTSGGERDVMWRIAISSDGKVQAYWGSTGTTAAKATRASLTGIIYPLI